MIASISRRAFVGASLALPVTRAARADALPLPSSYPILEIAGRISRTNGAGVARFDRAMLDGLAQSGFETHSPWGDGKIRFDGVLGHTLVHAVGAEGRVAVATALNDYRVTIPLEDFGRDGLLLATRRDGEELPVRARGPIWIVYPFDQQARFRSEQYYSRSIWQLMRIDFQD